MTEQTSDPTDPATRLRGAAAALTTLIDEGSDLPWTYFEDHGRDATDEGWSDVGLLDGTGQRIAYTHGQGFEDSGAPEVDAALVASLSEVAPLLVEAMNDAAAVYEHVTEADEGTFPDEPGEGDLATSTNGETYTFDGSAWQPSGLAARMLAMADAVLGNWPGLSADVAPSLVLLTGGKA